MIRPRLSKVASGTTLTTDLVNDIINRTEYAADLLRQYKLTAGNEMYVEPHYDGTRVSYLQPVAGGATPTQPVSVYDVEMVVGQEYLFPLDFEFATDATGFVPLEKRNRLVFPQFVIENRGAYALRYIGYFWAWLTNPPNAQGLYPSFGSPAVFSQINLSSRPNDTSFGPHPPFPNTITGQPESAWFAAQLDGVEGGRPGSATLILL
jgi:hypothetical protein